MSLETLWKISFHVKRNRNLTEEEFHKHWAEVHGPLVVPLLQRHGIIKYVQDHTPTSYNGLAEAAGMPREFSISEYDGTASFYVNKVEDLFGAMEDRFYVEKVVPDEEYFIERSELKVTVAREIIVINNNKVVEGKPIL